MLMDALIAVVNKLFPFYLLFILVLFPSFFFIILLVLTPPTIKLQVFKYLHYWKSNKLNPLKLFPIHMLHIKKK